MSIELNRERLCSLHAAYIQAAGSEKEDAFNALYRCFQATYRKKRSDLVESTREWNDADVETLFEEVFLKVLDKYVEGHYTKILETSIRNKVANEIKKLQTERKRTQKHFGKIIYLDDTEKKGDGYPRDSHIPVSDTQHPNEEPCKTDTEKKQLVSYLLTWAPPRARLLALLYTECGYNYTQAAAKYNQEHADGVNQKHINAEQVKRAVTSLAKGYNTEQFGNVGAFLRPAHA